MKIHKKITVAIVFKWHYWVRNSWKVEERIASHHIHQKKLVTKMIWPLPPQMCLGLPTYSIFHYLLVHQHGLYGYGRYTSWQKWEWMVSVLLGKDWQSFGHRTSNHWSKWLITASHQHTRLYALFRETVSYKHSSLMISKE